MAWYWIALIIAGVAGVVLVLGYVWGRKRSPAPLDQEKLNAEERKETEKRLRAEQAVRAKLEAAALELQKKQREIKDWYDANLKAIDASAKGEWERLSKDHDALDRLVDNLLAPRDSEPPSG
jgi:flagellar motility protein MotE (MotC chaperone)